MFKLKSRNKKAQVGEIIILAFSIIAVFIILVISLWAFNSISTINFFTPRSIAVKMSDSSSSLYSLKSYLSSTLELELNGKKETVTVSDLIRLWSMYNEDNYGTVLQTESEKIFKPFAKKEQANAYCYYLEIKNSISKAEIIQLGGRNLANLKEKATVEIPLFEDKTATVGLIIDNSCLKDAK